MPSFNWEGLARVLGNSVAKVALRAAEHAKDSVLGDLDRMLDGAKGKIADARGPIEPEKPRRAKVTVKGAEKTAAGARKAKKTAKPRPTVIEAEIVEETSEDKRPRE